MYTMVCINISLTTVFNYLTILQMLFIPSPDVKTCCSMQTAYSRGETHR